MMSAACSWQPPCRIPGLKSRKPRTNAESHPLGNVLGNLTSETDAHVNRDLNDRVWFCLGDLFNVDSSSGGSNDDWALNLSNYAEKEGTHIGVSVQGDREVVFAASKESLANHDLVTALSSTVSLLRDQVRADHAGRLLLDFLRPENIFFQPLPKY